jgi:hypothetical protein
MPRLLLMPARLLVWILSIGSMSRCAACSPVILDTKKQWRSSAAAKIGRRKMALVKIRPRSRLGLARKIPKNPETRRLLVGLVKILAVPMTLPRPIQVARSHREFQLMAQGGKSASPPCLQGQRIQQSHHGRIQPFRRTSLALGQS